MQVWPPCWPSGYSVARISLFLTALALRKSVRFPIVPKTGWDRFFFSDMYPGLPPAIKWTSFNVTINVNKTIKKLQSKPNPLIMTQPSCVTWLYICSVRTFGVTLVRDWQGRVDSHGSGYLSKFSSYDNMEMPQYHCC